MILEFFPPAAIALNQEVQNHPLLLAELSRMGPQADLAIQIGVVAAYCNVELDGPFLEEDLEVLFNLLIRRLKNKSEISLH
jgi:hypothetical protein